MNREIKFRAWKDEKMLKWEEFFDAPMSAFGEMIMINPPKPIAIFMQYTGLKDKNGKEIYEGDIMKFIFPPSKKNKMRGSIQFHKIEWNEANGQWWMRRGENNQSLSVRSRTHEVIGNIYENLELLK